MPTELVTPAELASWLQQDIDTATADLLIRQATGKVQAACGQDLVQVLNDTLVLEGSPEKWIWLPQHPVTAVHSVTFQDGNQAPVTLDPSQYTVSGNRMWRGFGWQYATVMMPPARVPYWKYLTYPPPSLITVVCDHGYAPGDMALEEARTVVLALCAQAYSNPGGSRSVTVDDYTETYSDAFAGMAMTAQMRDELRRRYGRRAGSVVPR
jgi:hypothetical protein